MIIPAFVIINNVHSAQMNVRRQLLKYPGTTEAQVTAREALVEKTKYLIRSDRQAIKIQALKDQNLDKRTYLRYLRRLMLEFLDCYS